MPQYEPVKYIVENVECMQGENGDLWVTSFRGKKTTLSEYVKPTWDVDDELPFKPKLVKPTDGSRWYYERPAEGEKKKPTAYAKAVPKTYTASPEKIESIELQNNKNNTTTIYCHCTEVGTPFNKDLFDEIFQIVKATGAESYLVKEAKRLGAVEQ